MYAEMPPLQFDIRRVHTRFLRIFAAGLKGSCHQMDLSRPIPRSEMLWTSLLSVLKKRGPGTLFVFKGICWGWNTAHLHFGLFHKPWNKGSLLNWLNNQYFMKSKGTPGCLNHGSTCFFFLFSLVDTFQAKNQEKFRAEKRRKRRSTRRESGKGASKMWGCPYPYHPCKGYLPTINIKMNQMLVNIP